MSLNDLLKVIEDEGITGKTRVTALMDLLPSYYSWMNDYGVEKSLVMSKAYYITMHNHYELLMNYDKIIKETDEGTK
jgi:hypothetical protein